MWPTMNARYPQSESAEAIEGNAAHFTAWSMLATRDRGSMGFQEPAEPSDSTISHFPELSINLFATHRDSRLGRQGKSGEDDGDGQIELPC